MPKYVHCTKHIVLDMQNYIVLRKYMFLHAEVQGKKKEINYNKTTVVDGIVRYGGSSFELSYIQGGSDMTSSKFSNCVQFNVNFKTIQKLSNLS